HSAPVIAGDHADRAANDERGEDRRETDDHRNPGAVDDPGKHVAAQLVGAEPELRVGMSSRRSDARFGVGLDREEAGEDRSQDDEGDPPDGYPEDRTEFLSRPLAWQDDPLGCRAALGGEDGIDVELAG